MSLYETLRVEVGSDIGITIVTPGYIESELTKGKFLKAEEGKVDVDQDLRDVSIFAVINQPQCIFTISLFITSLVITIEFCKQAKMYGCRLK